MSAVFRSFGLSVLAIFLSASLLGFSSRPAFAQAKNAAANPPPPPEPVDLTTDDGLELNATFFPGTKGKDSIPVILIHALGPKNKSTDFTQPDGLAEFLQVKLGCRGDRSRPTRPRREYQVVGSVRETREG